MQRGFSLIELVIVVVVLGLLAATALPRFLNVTEDAEDATVEGVAGGFATGIGLIRAQWEIEGRPSQNNGANNTFVTIDGIQVGVDKDTGYPTGVANNNTEDENLDAADCLAIFKDIIQSAPTITSTWAPSGDNPFDGSRYFTATSDGTGSSAGNGGASDVCFYYLTQTVKNVTAQPTDSTVGNGFFYNTRLGQIEVFSNN